MWMWINTCALTYAHAPHQRRQNDIGKKKKKREALNDVYIWIAKRHGMCSTCCPVALLRLGGVLIYKCKQWQCSCSLGSRKLGLHRRQGSSSSPLLHLNAVRRAHGTNVSCYISAHLRHCVCSSGSIALAQCLVYALSATLNHFLSRHFWAN